MAEVPQELSGSASVDPYAATLVAVHGIGNQRPGEHLRSTANSLMRAWADAGVEVNTVDAVLSRTEQDPPHMQIEVASQRLLLVEAHWSDVLPEDRFTTVATWLLVVAPFTVIGLVRDLPRRFRELYPLGRLSAIAWLVAAGLTRFVVGAILFPLWFAPLLALVALTSVLPGRVGKAALGGLQAFISSVLGDSFRFVNDPSVREEVLTRVRLDLEWARVRSHRVICVGHSQGAHIAMKAITAAASDTETQFELWTWGSGFRKLHELETITEQSPASTVRALLPVLGLPTLALLSLLSGGWWALLVAGIGALMVLVWWLREFAPQLDLKPSQVDEAVPATVAWTDLWSTHDAVPDGGIPGDRANSHPVVNRRSAIWDHSSYHQNAEEVILPLANALCLGQPKQLIVTDELAEVRRQWWGSYRMLTFLGVVGLGLTLLLRQRESVGLTALTIAVLLTWARVELAWRLRYRRQVGDQRRSRWLESSHHPGDYSRFVWSAGVGIALSVIVGSRPIGWTPVDPLDFSALTVTFDLRTIASTLGALILTLASYLLLRTDTRARGAP